MNIFKKANLSDDWKCPVCGKNDQKPVTLIPIRGTADGKGLIECAQVHVHCIKLELIEIGEEGYFMQRYK